MPEELTALNPTLQAGWREISGKSNPDTGDAAAAEMVNFLAMNGIRGKGITESVMQARGEQYAAEDKRFIPKEERRGAAAVMKPTSITVLAWSRNVWQMANYMLSDGAPEPLERAKFIADALTSMIGSRHIGCNDCQKHWQANIKQFPAPEEGDLHLVRKWLVDIHNASSPHTPAWSMEQVANAFGWTLPTESEPGPSEEAPSLAPIDPALSDAIAEHNMENPND